MRTTLIKRMTIVASMVTLAFTSTSCFAYSNAQIQQNAAQLTKNQLQTLDMIGEAYGLNDQVIKDLRIEWKKMTQNPRVAEHFLAEIDKIQSMSTSTDAKKNEALKLYSVLFNKGFARLPAEDAIFFQKFHSKLAQSLPAEACKTYLFASEGGVIFVKAFRPALQEFFSKQKSEDIVRYLSIQPRSILAEVTNYPPRVRFTKAEEERAMASFQKIAMEVFGSLSKEKKRRFQMAIQNPQYAPACDLCYTDELTFKIFNKADPSAQAVMAYKIMENAIIN